MGTLKRTTRLFLVTMLITGLSSPAFAGDLMESIANAAAHQAAQSQPPPPVATRPIPKKYLWPGVAMFAGGLTVGLYEFMHNKNGEFPGNNEYSATDKVVGGVALGTAFAGGWLLYLGSRAPRSSATAAVVPGGVKVAARIAW
jgi:hypothetical protein